MLYLLLTFPVIVCDSLFQPSSFIKNSTFAPSSSRGLYADETLFIGLATVISYLVYLTFIVSPIKIGLLNTKLLPDSFTVISSLSVKIVSSKIPTWQGYVVAPVPVMLTCSDIFAPYSTSGQ